MNKKRSGGLYLSAFLIYCFITMTWGINHTKRILKNDIVTQKWEWGRNELICSYWYDLYNPSKTLKWYKKNINRPLIYVSGDKAATPNYLKHWEVEIHNGIEYIWCIYPSNIKLNGYSLKRVNPELSWQNIYHIEPLQ